MGYTYNPKARGQVLQGCRGRTANLIFFGLLVAVLILCQLPALAQHAAGSIAGAVADKSGAVIPGAKVTVKNEANNNTFDGVTNGSGIFSFPTILPGTYTVTVTAPGLQTYELQHVTVTQGAAVGIPTITLQVATTKEQIEIVASGDMAVPIDSPQVSQTLNQNMITDLSIVGRDAAELMKIMPGMAMTQGLGQGMWNSYTTQINTGPIGAFSANGTQPNGAVTMTSDGANLLDPGNQGTQTANINQNQVAEVSVLTSAYDASFSKGPVTLQAYGKSGSAQFHGQAYLYTRNGQFNSIDAYDKSQGLKPISDSFYYPGGDFGGPVLIPGSKFNRNRDKLFFYGAYEYMKQKPAGSSYQFFVPTSDMLAGNFTPAYLATLGPQWTSSGARSNGAVVPNCVGGSGSGPGCGNMTIPNGQIPQSMIDANSLAVMKLDPAANENPTTNSTGSNYYYFLGPPVNRWELRLRGDYNISDKTKLYFSWNHQHEIDQNPFYVWWWGSPSTLPYPSSQDATQLANVYSANLVHVFSPTLTNEFVFADAIFDNPVVLANPDAVNPAKIGMTYTGFFKDPYTPQIPDIYGWNNVISGFYTEQYGSVFKGMKNTFGKDSSTPNIADNINYVVGKHTLKAGFYWDFAQNYQSSTGVGSVMGEADFENWGATSSGNPLADELIAHASGWSQSNGGVTNNFKYYTYGWYVNDSWKAGRRLTLTLGIRLDHLGEWTASNCPGFPVGTSQISPCPGLAVWDPATYTNNSASSTIPWQGVQWHAINSAIPTSGFPSKSVFPLPRVGAAYDIFGDGKTVVRGGIGLYRYQLAYNSVSGSSFNDPLGVESLGNTWGCCVGWNNFSAFSPASGVPGEGSSQGGLLQMNDEKTPYTWTYNVTVDQRLPGRSVLELQYTGNKSKDEMLHSSLSNLDNIPFKAFFGPDPLTGNTIGFMNNPASFSGFPTNDFLPIQFYTSMQLVSHGSYSNYNGFVASWQKQTGRITFTTNYTFSKVLGVRDQESDNGAGDGTTLWPYSLAANYGTLAWDHTHIFNAAYVINLPSPVKGNPFLGGVVNGWVLSGITQAQSGAPIQPNTGGTLNVNFGPNYTNMIELGTNSATLSPLLTCDPRKGLSSGQYFNPGCFTPPPPGTEGNIIWPYIHGPAFFNSDLAIYKRFAFKEHQRVELRFSAFNFLNHPLPQFGMGGANDLNLSFTNSSNALLLTNQSANTNGKPMFDSNGVRRVVEFAAKYNF
ncbi:MAG: carboxypeptidase-like regulatory domain-containing protein [Bryobacteraceae bacterium]